MSLQPASRLGPYEILGRLGAGAMGEVYRARDPRLGRDVAIKILPADVSSDAGRRARFEQEARAVAALNHPNILGLYDIGNEDGTAYLVTEFVAGETLAALLERGPLGMRKLLDIAVQIADGVAAAHAARITHRDLKPLNIMVGGDGRIRILDFGLAKQTEQSADPDATVLAGNTQPGMILGTVNYMSPEQARGLPADYRSDQFSFGLILYEMVTGKRAFERPESVQTMSAIIGEDQPPIEQNIPAPLRWVIDRCLAKDPAERYESSRDLFHGLRSLRDHASEASVSRPPAAAPVPAPPPPRHRFPRAIPSAFVLGLLAAAVLHLWTAGPEMPDQSAYHFTPFSFAPGGQSDPVWSPDGKAVAYSARGAEGPYQTYIRYLDSAVPVQVTHTSEDASPMAWAPDGQRLLLDIDRRPRGIWSIAPVGGEPEIFVPSTPPSRLISISPDNRSVAFFYPGDDDRYGIWISSPPTAAPRRYLPDPFATKDLYNTPKLRFSPDGKQILLYLNAARQGEEAWLMPYPPDPSHPPKRIFPSLPSYGGTPVFCWMPDSRRVLLSVATRDDSPAQLWLADTVSGEYHALTSGTASRFGPAVSPDGRHIIFGENTGCYDIVSVDLESAALHPLIATERDELMPAWAAHKPLLAFVTDRNGPQEIWLHSADNADRPLVTARDFPEVRVQWFMGPALSPEGDRVIYSRIDAGARSNRLWISAVAGGPAVPLTNDHAAEYSGSWTEDGSWFAYVAFRDGKPNLMKVKTSGQATPVAILADVSYENNAAPVWSPGGEEILLGESLYSADGKRVRSLGNHHADGYVFAPDGKRVYGLRPSKEGEELFSVEVATGAEKVIGQIGKEGRPRSNLSPAMRFSLAPGGKSITYGVGRFQSNLWMLEGIGGKRSWFQRLGL